MKETPPIDTTSDTRHVESTPSQQQLAQTPSYTGENPGQTLGILSIIMTIPLGFSVIGIVLGVISRNQSKAVNAPTTLGTVGLVIGIIGTVLGLLTFLAFVLIFVIAANNGTPMNFEPSSIRT